MNAVGLPDWLGKPFAVLLIDLSLAGDNALVIALVCQSLPPPGRRVVLLIGTVGAIVLRVMLAGLAGIVLAVPGLKLVSGVVLALLALNLVRRDPRRAAVAPLLDARSGILTAALLVTLIDVLMSLDNVFALAAVAGGSMLYLGLGLLLSVSILMFGSVLVAQLVARHPGLTRLGAALLGWVAGGMAVADPLFQGRIATQAPALPLLVPALAAAYVYLLGRDAPRHGAALDVLAARPAPPARREVARKIPEPAVATPPDGETAAPDRALLYMLIGLFVIVGLFLGVLAFYAGGIAR